MPDAKLTVCVTLAGVCALVAVVAAQEPEAPSRRAAAVIAPHGGSSSQQMERRVRRFDASSRTRGMAWGWGHSWSPFFGRTRSHLGFIAFHPQMGWFVSDRIEVYGEGTLFLYHRPAGEFTAGLGGLAGRAHFWNDRAVTPYIVAGVGLLWTSLNVREIDRVFNFQHFGGVGVRWAPVRGPGLTIELRNHHISNAGTAGDNLGVNAGTIVAGAQWILR